MRSAVIDIGSSSIKLIIGEKSGNEIRSIETLKSVIPLGKNTFLKGRISQEIINQTVSLLEKYQQKIKEYDVDDLTVVATTAVREARNKDIFIDAVERKTGFKIEVLNVGDVVYYIDAFLSHKLKKSFSIHEKNLLIAELGAGSLDISLMEKGNNLFNVGLPIGTLRLRQFMSALDGSHDEVCETTCEYLENEILQVRNIDPNLRIDDIILIDENYSVYLPNVISSLKKRETNFFPVARAEVEEFTQKLREVNVDGINSQYKIPVETAETITTYSMVLDTLFKLTNSPNIHIFQASLAQAILAHNLFKLGQEKENNKADQLISVARFLCRQYNQDLKHCEQVASFCDVLFNAFKELLGLQDNQLIYLKMAAYLHDVGMFVNNRSHHKHSEYIISSLNLFRLTEEETQVVACVGRYHRRGNPSETHPLYNSLSTADQILVQKLSSLLRIANALDRSHKQKIKKIEVKFNRRQDVSLVAYTTDNVILEKSYFQDKKSLFEEVTGNCISLTIKTQG